MKRLWIGITIITILLTLGIGSSVAMEKIHAPIAHQLRKAGSAAQAGHWQEAQILAAGARHRWQSYWNIVACLTDHDAMEDADEQFARLAVWEREKEAASFSAGCAGLSALFEAMADVQDINLWNLM